MNNLAMTERPAKWYAVNTNPKCEDIVCRLLDDEGFEVFLPKIKNSKRNLLEPLFPGYIFVRLNLASSGWGNIRYLHGVRKILSVGSRPVCIPEAIINAIRHGVNTADYRRTVLSLKAGETVRFTKGPFAGLEGEFTGEMSGKERVKILLQTIQQSFIVEAEAAELTRLAGA